MIDSFWDKVEGIIKQGHKVASGSASDSPYPGGTIEMQIPFFKELGLDLTDFFNGTLNVSINPKTFQLVKPEFTFLDVNWTDKHPPEHFSFSRCRVLFQDVKYDSFVYYPHPETKQRHFQNPSILEIIAPFIPEIRYESKIEIQYNPLEIIIHNS